MKPLAVYVHIPFCTVKCGYCDFNAYSGMDNEKPAYGDALVREIRAARPLFQGRVVRSIGFGGGTPSEVPEAQIAAAVKSIRDSGPVSPDIEISLEANPGTTTEATLLGLRNAGVTRLSIGAQSFSAAELRFLDRIHSPEATVASVNLARAAGFASVGLDLIYGLPAQSHATWQETLACAIKLAPDHVSTYALTVEDGTPLARRVRKGEVVLPDEDTLADLYEAASDRLAASGYEQYELSNWAKPGHHSRHNMTYWSDGDYLGIGAGAHGYIDGERYENVAHPREYVARVLAGNDPPLVAIAKRYTPGSELSMSDWLSLRLRLISGFDPGEFNERFGRDVPMPIWSVLEECAQAGVIELAPRVRLTLRGRLLHGEVSARILAVLMPASSAKDLVD